MEEIWKDIINYEGYYKLSNLGRVMSLDRKVIGIDGVEQNFKQRILSININKKGYPSVTLSKDSRSRSIPIHRLLGIVFLPNPDNFPVVRHLNDVKTDFRLENLCWGTQKQNSNDAIINGGMKSGKNHHCFGRTKELHPNYKKTGEKNKNSKLILNLETGIFYYGIKEAANSIGSNYSTLASKLVGNDRNNTSLIYV
jgi:hypothetical protein